ncbi:MAG TPA: alpha/beta fold hydrolase [Burkholderiaceae bacterium]|nr:alpha/beta fold hydrolase [Burkholderiaceae bacterium]
MNPSPWNYAEPLNAAFQQMDWIRCQQGKLLDSAGLGRLETPYRILHSETGLKVRKYDRTVASNVPAVLIVPAPIKRAYIWDLSPDISVVRRCIEHDMQVYLAEWTTVDDTQRDWGLEDYGDRFLSACLGAIEADSGETAAVIAAHSLGGVFATIFACMRPEKVRALLLLETPLHFAGDAGDFAPLVAATPDTRPLETAPGVIPGSLLSLVSAIAAPRTFQWERCMDWSLSMASPKALDTCIRVERWTYDEFPLPARLFSEIVEMLYRDDRLMNGRLRIQDKLIGPGALHVPLLNVIDPHSTIIPPRSVLPFHEAAASAVKKVLTYEGDFGIGIQHVGVLVGTNAHHFLWPAIFNWLASLSIIR